MKSHRLLSLLTLMVVAALPAPGADVTDTKRGHESRKSTETKPVDSEPDSLSVIVRIVDFVAHPTLQVVTWPLQHVVAPGVEFLTYPTQPPIRYFLQENVIDRATGLFQFGPSQDFSIYPTVSLASGTASRTGATLRHQSPFGRENERLAAYFQYYVNGDYRIRAYLASRGLGGTPFNGKVGFALNRLESGRFFQPEVNLPFYHALNSESYETQLDYPVYEEFRLRVGFDVLNNRYGEAPPVVADQPSNTLTSGFFQSDTGFDPTGAYRGLNQSFLDRMWQVALVRDTRSNENIPLDGSRFELGWNYHDVQLDHSFYEWKGRYTTYFKLGAERYEITAREEKQLGGTAIDRFVRRLEYQRLRQSIFSRKVVVFQVFGGQSYELPGNSMPVYGPQSLGNGTPLRAYAGSRYRNYAVTATSMEYRFPILRIMDGTVFNEYGVFGSSMGELDFKNNLRNSWGFGVRVRQPDMFLFRLEAAFHGLSGIVFNATADTPF